MEGKGDVYFKPPQIWVLCTRFPGVLVPNCCHLCFSSRCFARRESKIRQRENTPKMFSLTWKNQQFATDLMLACAPSKQLQGLPGVFPSQSCLRSFVLPPGTFLPMISGDVWRYFGISPLSLAILHSSSLVWLLWSAALASATEISCPIQLPQVSSDTLSSRQKSTVRLICNDKSALPLLLISMQTKWCHRTLKTEKAKSKEILSINWVPSRWVKRDGERLTNKAKICTQPYYILITFQSSQASSLGITSSCT